MDKAQELFDLAGKAEARITAQYPTSGAGPRLGWAAFNLGGVLAAVSMIDKLANSRGLGELRAALGIDSYDVIEAAAVGLAARGAVSAMDLCAAAAWTTKGGAARKGVLEADMGWVADADRIKQLHPEHKAWVKSVMQTPEWKLVLACRHQATHRMFGRRIPIKLGQHRLPVAEFEVAGAMHPADTLVRQFAQNSESWFRQFCALLLT